MTLHAYLFGVGIWKMGYDSEYGYDPERDIGLRDRPMGMTLTQYDAKGRLIEFGGQGPGEPFFSAVLPHDFVVPSGTRKLAEARWACHRVIRHIDEIKADPKYSSKRDLKPCMSMEDYTKSYTHVSKTYRAGRTSDRYVAGTTKPRAEYVELWEIHCRQTGKVYVIATGYDKFLRNEDDAMQLGGKLPFIDIAFTPRTRCFWTTPDAKYLEPHQAELTDIHAQATKVRRTNVQKMLVDRNMIDETELNKATTADVGPYLVVNGNPRDVMAPMPPMSNQNLFMDAEQVKRASREAVGLSSNQFGEYDSSSRRTAAEAQIVESASNRRMNRRELVIRNAYILIGHMVQEVVFNFWTDERVVPYIGQDGAQQWARYHGDALAGKYKCRVSFTSEDDPTRTQQKQAAVQKAQVMAQGGVPGDVVMRYLIEQLDDPAMKAAIASGGTGNGGQVPGSMGGVQAGQMANGVPPQGPPASGPQ
jgi:hypothetical protein